MIEVLDTTLREGEQTPGVKFSYEEKLEIANLLDRIGIDFIEIGNPSISERDKEDLKKLSSQNFDAETICHSRAMEKDIDRVLETDAKWIGIFAGINQNSLKCKYGKKEEEVLEMVKNSITYAKDHGLNVRFTVEDASRTSFPNLSSIVEVAEDSDADRISLADTVGELTPEEASELVERGKDMTDLPLHGHFHNDLGLATANALAALKSGIDLVDTSVNNLGERTGITSLSELLVVLNKKHDIDRWNLELLPELSEAVEEYSGIKASDQAPVVGRNAFTHTGGLHQSAVLEEMKCYQNIDPSMLGRDSKMYIGPLSSLDAFKLYVEKRDIDLGEKSLKEAYRELKEGDRPDYQGTLVLD